MRWDNCYSDKRSGSSKTKEVPRTEYQRDFDRLIFASSFRRLQNKTQVFPLPGSTFVHNRLTHSLEVSSVGRSLGKIVGDHIASHDIDPSDETSVHFYTYDLSSVIASACLAHDIGNPAFGHSGEKAISNYFISNQDHVIDKKSLRSFFSHDEWLDLTQFEGNANALRVLTHSYKNKPTGGLRLTYSTLAAILKYPCEASALDKRFAHRKKYGVFLSELGTLKDIAKETGMHIESDTPLCFKRHPFVYLVEAADDICYRIVDLEDAHRLGIVSRETVQKHLLGIISHLENSAEELSQIQNTFHTIHDKNDSVAYLRAKTINALTNEASNVFINNKVQILSGTFEGSLLSSIEARNPALRDIMNFSVKNIYNHHSVVEIEITGFHVMSFLLGLMVPAVLRERSQGADRMVLELVPNQFREYETTTSAYTKVLSIVDYISGMTDTYATELYRKTTGIDISKHN